MALSTYSDLKTAIAEWAERGDLTSRIPDFIALAEVKIGQRFRGRMSEVNSPLVTTPGSRLVALPAGFSEAVALSMVASDGSREGLRYVDPGLIDARSSLGRPSAWTVDGGNLAFDCAADQAYSLSLRHLLKFTLSDANPTNAILTDYPDVYLFGSLLEVGPFLRDADLLIMFQQKFDVALSEANRKESRNRSKSTLSVDPALRRGSALSGFNIIHG